MIHRRNIPHLKAARVLIATSLTLSIIHPIAHTEPVIHTAKPLHQIPQLPIDPAPPEKPPWIQRIFLKKEAPPKESEIIEVGPRHHQNNPATMVRLGQSICLSSPQGKKQIPAGFYLAKIDWLPSANNNNNNNNNNESDLIQEAGQLTLYQGSRMIGAISLPHQQALPALPQTRPRHQTSLAPKTIQLISEENGTLRLRVDVPESMSSWFSVPCQCISETSRF